MTIASLPDCRVPYSTSAMQEAASRLERGDGRVIVEGIPVDPHDLGKCQALAVELMKPFGELASQDAEGTIAYLLRDEGVKVKYGEAGRRRTTPGVRTSKSNAKIRFHNDSGARWASHAVDTLGTLMVSDGIAGGDIHIIDGCEVYERLKRRDPEAVETLKRPFAFDTATRPGRDGLPFSWGPIFYDYDGRFELRVSLARVQMAADFLGTPFTKEQQRALDALEATFYEPDIAIRLHMNPGELLLLDDRRMLHSREEFEDGEVPENKRVLIRLWAQRPPSL